MPTDPVLARLQSKAAEARDLELEIEHLNEQIKEKSVALRRILDDDLPELFDEAKIDHVGIPADGNKPAIDYRMRPYYSASIAASWPEDKKAGAYAFLKSVKAESLIRTEVSARLPKGNLKAARSIYAAMKKLGVKGAVIEMRQSVHQGTLSAWLREVYERGQSLPTDKLALIGGSVGRTVKAEERKT